MPSYITSQEVLALYPRIPSSLKSYITRSTLITSFDGTQNTVFFIDDKYVLRTRKIQLYPFDDIGSCGNFKIAIEHIDKYHFIYHPNHLVFEQLIGPGGEAVEFLLYKR